MKTQTLKHNGTTYTIKPLTGLQMLDNENGYLTAMRIELSYQLGWAKRSEDSLIPEGQVWGYRLARAETFLMWLQVTSIEGDSKLAGASLENEDKLGDYYNVWLELVTNDDELFKKWQTAYNKANMKQNDPEASSDVENGEPNSTSQ